MPFDLSAQFNSSFIDYSTLTKDLLAVSECHSLFRSLQTTRVLRLFSKNNCCQIRLSRRWYQKKQEQ